MGKTAAAVAAMLLIPNISHEFDGGKYAGFIFVHFFGGFLATTPHLDNVTDDRRYSRLLADFPSVGVGIILTVRFLEKRSF